MEKLPKVRAGLDRVGCCITKDIGRSRAGVGHELVWVVAIGVVYFVERGVCD
jgi:hypothetical protein